MATSSVSSRPIRNSVSRVPMYPDPPVITYFISSPISPARWGDSSYACRVTPAPWRSGYAAACKAVYTGSIPVGALAESPVTSGVSGFLGLIGQSECVPVVSRKRLLQQARILRSGLVMEVSLRRGVVLVTHVGLH